METGPSVRARRPTPTPSAADARRHTARPRPPPVPSRRDSAAYPFQPLSFLSDSSSDDDDDDDDQTSASPDPVARFGLPYQRDRPARPSISPATPRASFSASSASSSTHLRTPGSLDSTRNPLQQAHWREASVGGGALQQAEWLAHVSEEMTASLHRLAENVRLAQDEMLDTRKVLEERRRKVLLASSASTDSWSATAFKPSFQGHPPQVVAASQSGESYYSAPSFFASSTTASSLSYSEASTSTSPSYSSASYYSASPSASTSHGSFS